MRVIQLKITPPPVGTSVARRTRVEALLGRLVEQHRVVLVLATAGAGKTTAVLQAAGQLRRPLAWLSVDATDTVTGRLLTYLEAAISRQIPEVEGVAAAALASQLPHAEVAGLLAEAVGDRNLLLVLDDMERLADEPEALAVVTSFARYLPPAARLVMISRTVLPFDTVSGSSFPSLVAAVGEEDLAFTVQEATDALLLSGRPDIDPAEAIVETGGWVTGVLFEAWHSADHVIGIGGEADPLHGYLATQILAQLGAADREFLISTAMLEEVTAPAAESLGVEGAAARLHSLRHRRLPVAWDAAGKAMRCHPRFREYLLELLGRRGEAEVRALHRAYARLLVDRQHDEEAVEEFLAAGRPDEALEVADRVIVAIVERTDFALAERWLARLDPVRGRPRLGLVVAELMLALGREHYARGAQLADELAAADRRDEVAAVSGRAAGLMAWCYLHAGRVADIHAVLDAAPAGAETDAMRYALRTVDEEPADAADGSLTGGPFDALVLRTHYDLGRLSMLAEVPASPWAAKGAEPWRVGALLATGHTEQAFELYQSLAGAHEPGVWLAADIGPRLMAELGEREAAWRLLWTGRERTVASGSELFGILSRLTEAEFLLRLRGDTAAAREVLEDVAAHPIGQGYATIREHAGTLLGAALLAAGEDERARDRLDRAVAGMRRGGRILWLPAAAVLLAEAQWRLGEEQSADDAANLALAAAERQGSNHLLLQALADHPAVLSRRLDSERRADSPWHELGRALMVQGVELGDVLAAAVHVTEFGRAAVLVNGEDAALRLRKSYELLVYLATCGRADVPRQELLDVLFEGRRGDDSAGSYLRQAVLRLRRAVPDVLRTDTAAGRIGLGENVRVSTESERLGTLLRQAASLRGQDRLRTLLQALEIADRGEYLPGVTSSWADERRRHLGSIVQEARHEAAEIAFATGHFRQAARLVGEVLRADPFRESAWRLEMRIADALGDRDRVVAAYRACERALTELGTSPARTTVQLLQDLRR